MPCLQHAALKRSASGRSRPGNQRRPLYPDEPPPPSASTRTWPFTGAPGPNRSTPLPRRTPLRRRLRANMAVYRSAGLKPKRLLRSGEPPPPSAATRTWLSAGAPSTIRRTLSAVGSARTWPSTGAPSPIRRTPSAVGRHTDMAVRRSARLKPKHLLRSGEPSPPSASTRTWLSAGAPGPNRSAFYDQASPLRRRPPREHGRLPSKTTHLSNTEREKLEREIVGLPSKTTQLSNTDGGAICNR